jgi:hypothetical protein
MKSFVVGAGLSALASAFSTEVLFKRAPHKIGDECTEDQGLNWGCGTHQYCVGGRCIRAPNCPCKPTDYCEGNYCKSKTLGKECPDDTAINWGCGENEFCEGGYCRPSKYCWNDSHGSYCYTGRERVHPAGADWKKEADGTKCITECTDCVLYMEVCDGYGPGVHDCSVSYEWVDSCKADAEKSLD